MADLQELQKQFSVGKANDDLNGFYKGSLDAIIPKTMKESIGATVAKIWLPWKGKWFYRSDRRGDNILPSFFELPFRLIFDSFYTTHGGGMFHTFLFKTSIEKGLKDPISVLRLDYDLDENPPEVRKVVDELVQTGPDVYLGKAFVKENDEYRLVAYFSLRKA